MKFTSIFVIICLCISFHSQAQKADSTSINDLFVQYVSQKLQLTKSEVSKTKPLIKKYLNERKSIIKTYKDPLERERQTVILKFKYRKQFIPLLGAEKANAFFTQEQNFRRQVREELRKRKK